MEDLEKMSRYYTAMLKTICGADYEKVQAASHIAAVAHDIYCLAVLDNRVKSKAKTEKIS